MKHRKLLGVLWLLLAGVNLAGGGVAAADGELLRVTVHTAAFFVSLLNAATIMEA